MRMYDYTPVSKACYKLCLAIEEFLPASELSTNIIIEACELGNKINDYELKLNEDADKCQEPLVG